MVKKVLFAVTTLGLAVASAASSYKVTLFAPGMVNGSELKAGDYKVEVRDNKAILTQGKVKTEASIRVEDTEKKAPTTAVKYVNGNIAEIRLGGTKTKLVFENATPAQQTVGN